VINMSQDEDKFSLYLFTITRVTMGWIFFFSFLARIFGLSYDPSAWAMTGTNIEGRSWFAGNSPTAGYLGNIPDSKWLSDTFVGMAGNPFVDFLYMMGMLGVGLAMILGIGRKIAAISGALMMFLMYLAALPIPTNPFVDSHIVYALVFLILGFTKNHGIIFVPQWAPIAEKYPILE
jgi:thiosulfate dehydrogenase (quinone) large subunit